MAVAAVTVAAACSSGSIQVEVEGPDDVTPTPTTLPATPAPTPEPAPPPVDEQALAELDAARTLWAAAAIDSYVYTFTQSCECDNIGELRVTVADGEASIADVFGATPDVTPQTIEDLYEAIERSIQEGDQTEVTYDAVDGHPMLVLLDLEAMEVDGGYAIEVSELVDLGAATGELDSAEARWAASGITSYQMTYREACFCPEIIVQVTVVDGAVVETASLGDFDPGGPGRTVEDLFDEIRSAFASGAVSVVATYDLDLGYPTEYFVDYAANIADEEFGITVQSLDPA